MIEELPQAAGADHRLSIQKSVTAVNEMITTYFALKGSGREESGLYGRRGVL